MTSQSSLVRKIQRVGSFLRSSKTFRLFDFSSFFFFFFLQKFKKCLLIFLLFSLVSFLSSRLDEAFCRMEKQLYEAALLGKTGLFLDILDRNPDTDVNWKYFEGNTALHAAARFGHRDIVKRLLAHPKIRVPEKNDAGETPLVTSLLSTSYSNVPILLLRDDRMDFSFEGAEGQALLEKIKLNYSQPSKKTRDSKLPFFHFMFS